MLRSPLARSTPEVDSSGFRLRGKEVSRVEGLSDGVFALAMTLLIVSVEVPSNYADLMQAIRLLPVFACCFAILMWFWGCHYTYFRRYGLNDDATIVLNSVLLFLVLFYVFPMKYLFSLFLSQTMGVGPSSGISLSQLRGLFALYAAGFSSIAGVFAWMHLHAYRQAEALELTPAEKYLVRGSIARMLALVGIGAVSITIAFTAQGVWVTAAGFIYSVVGLTESLLARHFAEGAKRIAAQRPPQPAAATSTTSAAVTTEPVAH